MSFDVCVWFALMLMILENDENAMSVIFFVERDSKDCMELIVPCVF
jgi:hypothetical protein